MPRSKAMTWIALATLPALAVAPPALAQADPTASLDLLIQESLDPASAMALARRQSASGDFVAAVATIERVLLNPGATDDARLLHAGLLCRLDDPPSAKAELAELAGHPALTAGWPEITAACGAIEPPLATEGVK